MLGATFFRLRYIASWSASCGAVPFAAAPASAAVVSPLLPAGRMLNATPGEQSTKGEPTGGWMVTQVAAAAGIASCPPRALDASARIEAPDNELEHVSSSVTLAPAAKPPATLPT